MTRYNILNLAAGQGLAGKEKTPKALIIIQNASEMHGCM